MSSPLETAWQEVKDRWHHPVAALILLLALIVTLLALFGGPDGISPTEWVVTAICAITLVVVWAIQRRTPKNARDKIGVGVAMSFEEAGHRIRLHTDFIAALRRRLARTKHSHEFNLIEFPPHISATVKDSEAAADLSRKARLHLLIFGTARRRTGPDGKKVHALDLEARVSHRPIPENISIEFGREFGQLFPRELVIGEEGDFILFKVTAQLVDCVSRYIVAIAAGLSHDFGYAEELFKELESELAISDLTKFPSVAEMRRRIPKKLADLHRAHTMALSRAYKLSRETRYLEEAESVIAKLEEYAPGEYTTLLTKAICVFMLRRDVGRAKALIRKAERAAVDVTWLYSKAFLHAYEGDTQQAVKCYLRAFKGPLADATVPIQSEEFMHHILATEPEKVQLYLCLGLINYRVKKDLPSAKRELESFLKNVNRKKFRREQDAARKWLANIEIRLTEKRTEERS
jgi:tetratricopeptide (TPR) repeat protein